MEYLKPTKWKFIFTLLIPLYCTYTVQYQMSIPPEKSVWYQVVFYPIPLLFFYISNSFSQFTVTAHPLFSVGEKYLHFCLDFVVPAIFNYLIICLAFFLFSKFIKNLKKPDNSFPFG